jgi:hypothetical protein
LFVQIIIWRLNNYIEQLFIAISLGLAPNQLSSTELYLVSRVPEGEKIRKQDEREREAKFDEYNRPKVKEVKNKLKRVENRKRDYAWWM